jgi:hypothetical protein
MDDDKPHPNLHTYQLLDALWDDIEQVVEEIRREKPKYSSENLCLELEHFQRQILYLSQEALDKGMKDKRIEEERSGTRPQGE